jgi:hypothetical protein
MKKLLLSALLSLSLTGYSQWPSIMGGTYYIGTNGVNIVDLTNVIQGMYQVKTNFGQAHITNNMRLLGTLRAGYILTTNIVVFPNNDATTNLLLQVMDMATRGVPIMQVHDIQTGNIIWEIDNVGDTHTYNSIYASNVTWYGVITSTNLAAKLATNMMINTNFTLTQLVVTSNRINGVSNWVNAVSNRLDTFAVAGSNGIVNVMQVGTNYANGVTNISIVRTNHGGATIVNVGYLALGSTASSGNYRLEVSGSGYFTASVVADGLSVFGTNTLTYGNAGFVSAAHLVATETTNITLLATRHFTYVGSSNVNIVAIMGAPSLTVYKKTVVITNGTGVDWGIKFSAVSNNWKWPYTFGIGGAAPTVLTNATQLIIKADIEGTNVYADYKYYPWP